MSSISNNTQQLSNQNPPASVAAELEERRARGEGVDPATIVSKRPEISQGYSELSAKAAELGAVRQADAFDVSKIAGIAMPPGASGSMPTLPTHKVSASAMKEAGEAIQRLPSAQSIAITGSIADAMRILTEATNKMNDAQQKARQASGKSVISAAMKSAEEAKTKAEEDHKSAAMSFAANMAGTGASFAMAKAGTGSVSKAESVADSQPTKLLEKPPALETSKQEKVSQEKIAAQSAKTDDDISDIFSSAPTATSGMKPKKSELDQKVLEKKNSDSASSVASHNNVPGGLHEKQAVAEASPSASAEEASRKQANKSAMFTAASTAGQLITSANSAIDQNVGFAHAASEAEIAGKFSDVQKTMAEQAFDLSKGNQEKSQKMVDGAIDFLKQHFDLVKSTNDRIG